MEARETLDNAPKQDIGASAQGSITALEVLMAKNSDVRFDAHKHLSCSLGSHSEQSSSSDQAFRRSYDAEVAILGQMLFNLRVAIQPHLTAPIFHSGISIPTISNLPGSLVEAARDFAGPRDLYSPNTLITAAATSIAEFSNPAQIMNEEVLKNVLVFEYHPFALYSSLFVDSASVPVARRLDTLAGSNARISDIFTSEEQYWDHVREALLHVSQEYAEQTVEVVKVVSPGSIGTRFSALVEDVFDMMSSMGLGRPIILIEEDSNTAARGAAYLAGRFAQDRESLYQSQQREQAKITADAEYAILTELK